MGMDVYGRSPTSDVGRYFRRAVWGWRPLATFCEEVCPQFADKRWQTNDGWGLNHRDTIILANVIQHLIDSGEAAQYIRLRDHSLESAPNEPCDLCGATGTRRPVGETTGPGDPAQGGLKCNKCHGTGYVRPWSTWYHLDLDDLKSWVAFLRDSGGFKID